jgi:hypothetical protein
MRNKETPCVPVGLTTRREVLRRGAAIAAVSIIAPSLPRSARAQSAINTFDFYIATDGNDANPGTQAQPWAISSLCMNPVNSYNVANNAAIAGKTVGLLDGTYDVGPYCLLATTAAFPGDPGFCPGLSLPMGSSGSPTVIQSVNPRGAIIDGSSSTCKFTGFVSGTTLTVTAVASGRLAVGMGVYDTSRTLKWDTSGQGGTFITALGTGTGGTGTYILNNSGSVASIAMVAVAQCPLFGASDERSPNIGYCTVDGLVFQNPNGSGICVIFGTSGATTARFPGIVVQNCEFTSQDGTYMVPGDNGSSVQFAGVLGGVVQNCYFYDFTGDLSSGATDGDHWSATLQWASGRCLYQYNTVIGPGLFGKEGGNYGTIIRYNYVDNTGWKNAFTIQDFVGDTDTASGYATEIYNNVLVGNCSMLPTLGGSTYLPDKFYCYNNTFYILGPTNYPVSGMDIAVVNEGAYIYNNIFVQTYGSNGANFLSLSEGSQNVVDYNCYYATASGIYGYGYYPSNTSGGASWAAVSTLAAWQSRFSGMEANALNETNPELVSPGSTGPSNYKLQSGSPCIGAGRVGGVSAGGTVDMGAWGGTDVNTGALIARIGCNFAPGSAGSGSSALPDPPVLSVS